jgi:hypothetical protein
MSDPPKKLIRSGICMLSPSGTTVHILCNVMHQDLMAIFDDAVIVNSHVNADVGELYPGRSDTYQNIARLRLHFELAREASFIAKVVGAGCEEGGAGYERMNVNGGVRRGECPLNPIA